jgi:hypothetical protein
MQMVEIILWSLGMALVAMPVGLAFFAIFLMLTYPATEEEELDMAYWGDDADVDHRMKNR